MGGIRQVHTQESEVHLGHTGQLGDGSDDAIIVREDILSHTQLCGVDIQNLAVEQVGHSIELILGHAQQVRQGLTDDAVQGDQHSQGQHGPQAAAGGLDAFLLVELLQLDGVAFTVSAVLLLNELLLVGQAAHGHHALTALQEEGEEDDTDHQSKQQQSDAVAVGHAVEQQQQLGKGG